MSTPITARYLKRLEDQGPAPGEKDPRPLLAALGLLPKPEEKEKERP